MPLAEELPIDTDASALDMANAMFGNGISIQTASYTGAGSASGIYSNGDEAAPDITPSDTGVILSTGNATSITNSSGSENTNTSAGTSTSHGTSGDADLTEIAGQQTFDAAVFEASFVPEGSTLTMQVTFSSEEYLEYVNSGFNDAVGIWVNGEQAELTVGDGDITINNINDESNSNLYVDNAASDDTYNTEMDGFTVTLTLKAPVEPGQVNTIKIGIADGGDSAYDSNLLIAGNSVQTALVAEDDDITLEGGGSQEFDILANDSSADGSTLTITAINGVPVSVGDTITLSTGEVIELTDSGMVLASSELDGSGETITNTFTYEVTDEDGNTDVAFVNLTTVPCFVAGTLVETEYGLMPVEAVAPGMRIKTRDHGAQEVRWVGIAPRRALGADAPVLLEQGTFGANRALALSPNHRVLISDPRSALYFDTNEVLIAAKFLVGLPGVSRVNNGQALRYVHLLFDRHEVIETHGVTSESFHPAAQGLAGFSEQHAELARLFPSLEVGGPKAFGPTARPVVKSHEARLVVSLPGISRATAH
ncbi:choice-of-anchor L domain-containing protein [Roseobacteraceae bacterium S113]